ncbi:MAG: hypothetical protein GF350_13410, partial [Chitinivibrionales bacterium]|nr:hypothetical protein [Chitinivibrionales bacterium]
MTGKSRWINVCILGALLVSRLVAAPGNTEVAKWKNNKEAAFIFHFDDCPPTQVEYAIPEMTRRGLIGTWYYICFCDTKYGNGDVWRELVYTYPGQEIANHTMSHEGGDTYEWIDYQVGECARLIREFIPELQDKLMSFCWPGGTPWNISSAEKEEILKKHLLVARNRRGDCGRNVSAEEMFSFVQWALDNNDYSDYCFHGVGGDWYTISLDAFTEFLDMYMEVKDRIWNAGNLAVHKYIKERNTARISVPATGAGHIRLSLKSDMDPDLYDEPLTLITEVPANWSMCTVTQGGKSDAYQVSNGSVMYNAVPGNEEIVLTDGGATPIEQAPRRGSGLNTGFEGPGEVSIYDHRGRLQMRFDTRDM